MSNLFTSLMEARGTDMRRERWEEERRYKRQFETPSFEEQLKADLASSAAPAIVGGLANLGSSLLGKSTEKLAKNETFRKASSALKDAEREHDQIQTMVKGFASTGTSEEEGAFNYFRDKARQRAEKSGITGDMLDDFMLKNEESIRSIASSNLNSLHQRRKYLDSMSTIEEVQTNYSKGDSYFAKDPVGKFVTNLVSKFTKQDPRERSVRYLLTGYRNKDEAPQWYKDLESNDFVHTAHNLLQDSTSSVGQLSNFIEQYAADNNIDIEQEVANRAENQRLITNFENKNDNFRIWSRNNAKELEGLNFHDRLTVYAQKKLGFDKPNEYVKKLFYRGEAESFINPLREVAVQEFTLEDDDELTYSGLNPTNKDRVDKRVSTFLELGIDSFNKSLVEVLSKNPAVFDGVKTENQRRSLLYNYLDILSSEGLQSTLEDSFFSKPNEIQRLAMVEGFDGRAILMESIAGGQVPSLGNERNPSRPQTGYYVYPRALGQPEVQKPLNNIMESDISNEEKIRSINNAMDSLTRELTRRAEGRGFTDHRGQGMLDGRTLQSLDELKNSYLDRIELGAELRRKKEKIDLHNRET